jgi:hypothetical protein
VTTTRKSALPPSLAPRGLSRVVAAEYVGVSPSLFDQLVKEGVMPKPKRVRTRVLWDRLALDAAFAGLGDNDNEDCNPWDVIG